MSGGSPRPAAGAIVRDGNRMSTTSRLGLWEQDCSAATGVVIAGGRHQRAPAPTVSGRSRLMSTRTPGPIVDDSVIFLTYRPLVAAGLTRCNSSMTARKF